MMQYKWQKNYHKLQYISNRKNNYYFVKKSLKYLVDSEKSITFVIQKQQKNQIQLWQQKLQQTMVISY